MVAVLSAFQEMGMHEINNISLTHLALTSYEMLRPRFPNIVDVMAQVCVRQKLCWLFFVSRAQVWDYWTWQPEMVLAQPHIVLPCRFQDANRRIYKSLTLELWRDLILT